ncbi:hypothetical protein RRG08_033476 [Elysia crispata]|uniref:Uncharacterized protein n=1 Tax=Elysia crispata TaxID=231223 RepID=A0AAE1AUB0_9GAST|nr:hypothetical protein RRG08_033476 [Elysia crispata]
MSYHSMDLFSSKGEITVEIIPPGTVALRAIEKLLLSSQPNLKEATVTVQMWQSAEISRCERLWLKFRQKEVATAQVYGLPSSLTVF